MNSEDNLLENFVLNHAEEALSILEKQSEEEVSELMSMLPVQLSSRLLQIMDIFQAAKILAIMNVEQSTALLDAVPVNSAASILRLAEYDTRQHWLDQLPSDKANQLARSLSFSNETVGAHLDPVVFTLAQHHGVAEALEKVSAYPHSLSNKIAVLGENRKLIGYVGLKELIAANPQGKILSIMKPNPPSILADTRLSNELLEGRIWEESWDQVPVVGTDGEFLGVVSKIQLSRVKSGEKPSLRQAWQASGALAELYQIGLTSLFRSTND